MFLPNSRKQTRIVISFCNITNSIVIECELTIFVAVFVASSIKNCFKIRFHKSELSSLLLYNICNLNMESGIASPTCSKSQ